MTDIEIFKTSVEEEKSASDILSEMEKRFPNSEINFDLEDQDNILRVAASTEIIALIPLFMQEKGHRCEVL